MVREKNMTCSTCGLKFSSQGLAKHAPACSALRKRVGNGNGAIRFVVRTAGHVQPHESAGDYEKLWVGIWSDHGLSYRSIAALVYGISESKVTDGEMFRVGRLARDAGRGCNLYRTCRNDVSRSFMANVCNENKQAHPPRLSRFFQGLK